MRKLGIIGGTSWNSTALYYRYINEGVARRLGGLHSAPLLIDSIDFQPFANAQRDGRIDEAGAMIVAAAMRLAQGGAEALLLGSNTVHRYRDAVTDATGLPLLSIFDATTARLAGDRRRRIALIGTRATMTEEFASAPYAAAGMEILPLDAHWIDEIDRIIFTELVRGQVTRTSQRSLKTILTELDKRGAEAVVLGCTELALAVDTRANVLPVYDTTAIHAAAAVDWLVEGEAQESAAA